MPRASRAMARKMVRVRKVMARMLLGVWVVGAAAAAVGEGIFDGDLSMDFGG